MRSAECSCCSLQPYREGRVGRAGRRVNKCGLVVLMPVIAPCAFSSPDRQWETRLKLPQPYHSTPATRVNRFLFHSIARCRQHCCLFMAANPKVAKHSAYFWGGCLCKGKVKFQLWCKGVCSWSNNKHLCWMWSCHKNSSLGLTLFHLLGYYFKYLHKESSP